MHHFNLDQVLRVSGQYVHQDDATSNHLCSMTASTNLEGQCRPCDTTVCMCDDRALRHVSGKNEFPKMDKYLMVIVCLSQESLQMWFEDLAEKSGLEERAVLWRC